MVHNRLFIVFVNNWGTKMTERKFINPWSDTKGFVDLGTCNVDSGYFELYCFPGKDVEIFHIGARYGEDGAYISSTIVNQNLRDPLTGTVVPEMGHVCYHHTGPIAHALEHMLKANLLTQTVYDNTGNVIVEI
ncbi:conserved hypothetical protein [Vibrio jasicida]|jgi:hypothetical protein|uniref:Uncharacterized protein n=3 Tax=Vibrio TaxID=662 RepID=A0AAU9QKM2_9VIBR|nr:conserved hypothetical protein [Vibrio jasicida]CAH1596239.1 conserved hypothetical protein [Vibrio jasicida]